MQVVNQHRLKIKVPNQKQNHIPTEAINIGIVRLGILQGKDYKDALVTFRQSFRKAYANIYI
jgi:hypothetical protein